MDDLIFRDSAKRIIESPRSKEQMLAILESLPAQPEPCDDAVSREYVSKWLKQYGQDVLHGKYKFSLMYIWKNLMALPPVQPTHTDEQIQKMQAIEQAQLEKAFELGQEDAEPQSRIEKELHGLSPDEQYAFLDDLMHKKSVGWNSSALYVKAWLAGEED